MSDQPLTAQQSFENKIKDRLRGDIGDLIPDDLLTNLVQKAIQEMFFTKKEFKRDSYARTEVHPSWFEDEVFAVLRGIIKTTMEKYFTENGERIAQAVEAEIITNAPKLLANLLIESLSQQASRVAMNMETSLASRLNGLQQQNR